MAKGFRGGFGAKSGGGNNMQKLMQQAQAMPEAVDPDDVEMLQDLITAALNECIDTVDSETQEIMGKYTMGM